MASGDRNKKGKSTDAVFHFSQDYPIGWPICGTYRFSIITDGLKGGAVTCKNCAKKIAMFNKTRDLIYRGKGKIKAEIITD